MRRLTFDLDVLRTYVTGIEMGSFAKAADKLGRSTSAVSAQLKKLEQQLGVPVLRKEGRGMVTTPAGEALLGYARRLLELNDEAATAIRGDALAGSVRLGIQQDFGEHVLTEVLGRYARVHPRVRIEAHAASNAELLDLLNGGRLDMALAWDGGAAPPYATAVRQLAMCWIGAADEARLGPVLAQVHAQEALPLVVMDAPCVMRSAATRALDQAGIAWRIAFTSAGLSGVWAAVAAGLGVTVRTAVGLPLSVRMLDETTLPPLPQLGLSLYRAEAHLNPPAQRLHDIVLRSC